MLTPQGDPVGPFPGPVGHDLNLFITGLPRSGTTLAATLLNYHPRCCLFFESHFPLDLIQAFHPDCGPGTRHHICTTWEGAGATTPYCWGLHQVAFKLGLTLPDPEVLLSRSCIKGMWDRHWPEKQVLGDKSPYYALSWERVKRVLPDCKFIVILRPESECVESVLAQDWGYTRLGAEAWVHEHSEGLCHIHDCIFVELEWLQRDPREAVGVMLEWAGLDPTMMPWDAALAEMRNGPVN